MLFQLVTELCERWHVRFRVERRQYVFIFVLVHDAIQKSGLDCLQIVEVVLENVFDSTESWSVCEVVDSEVLEIFNTCFIKLPGVEGWEA